MSIVIQAVPLADNEKTMQRLRGLISGVRDTAPALRGIGALLTERTRMTFRDQRDPWGQSWAPLSMVTRLKRAEGRSGGAYRKRRDKAAGKVLKASAVRSIGSAQALLDTGRLRNSLTYNVSGGAVTIGTNVIYAGMQQYGAPARSFSGGRNPWGNVPARPFLPSRSRGSLNLPADWSAEVIGVVAKHLLLTVG